MRSSVCSSARGRARARRWRSSASPGIGKTALLDHAAARASGMQVLRARGIESEAQIPFASLLELLRPALGALDRIPEPQALALEGALALRPARAQERFAVGAATLSLLATLREQAAVAVLVDDAHWLDGPSAEALLFAVRRLVADPIAVWSRFARASPRCSTARTCRPSGSADSTAVKPRRCWTGSRRTSPPGCMTPPPATRSGCWSWPATQTSLRSHQRESRCSSRRGSRANSCAGWASSTRPSGGRCSSSQPATAATSRCWNARRAGWVSSSRRYPLPSAPGSCRYESGRLSSAIRSRAQRSTPAPTPTSAGRCTGRWRPRCPTATIDRRAWHLATAAAGVDEQASAALEQAALRARDRSAYATAALAFERAGRLASDGERRARLVLAAARQSWHAGSVPRAVALLDEARASTDERASLLEIDELAGHIATRQGPVMRGHAILTAAAEHADPERAIAMLAEATGACFYAGNPAEMLVVAERASSLVPKDASARTRFLASIAIGIARVAGGDAAAGSEAIQEAVVPGRCIARAARRPAAASVAGNRADLSARSQHRPRAARPRARGRAGSARRSGRCRSCST